MKEIFVERRENTIRIAIKENGKLQECIDQEEKNGPVIGEIYKGKIKNKKDKEKSLSHLKRHLYFTSGVFKL